MNLNEVLSLGNQLMNEHGLTQMGWRFGVDDAVRRFGVCRYGKNIITLSRPLCLLNDEAQVRDVILHEIAHALVGRGHGHDAVWKAKCREIGARPERCYDSNKATTPELRYQAICEACGKKHNKAKRPDSLSKYACRCQIGLPWSLRKTLIYKDTRC